MVDINTLVTALTVSYKAKDALVLVYDSLRRFYPHLPFLVIDGSPDDHSCQSYVNNIAIEDPYTSCFTLGYNIGHGRGMNLGISVIRTKFALVFDSDIEIVKPGVIEKMLELFDDGIVSVGEQYLMGIKGIRGVDVPYIHPWFHILKRIEYFKYFPYVHSGAPTHIHNADIYLRDHSDKAYKHFPVYKFVKHFKGGTRVINDDVDGKKAERKRGESNVKMWLRHEKGMDVKYRRLEKIA